MKWIGQHIWDFVSRFRNDVYFEGLAETNETRGLVVDADGKVSINPLSGDEHATHIYENVRNDEGATIPVGTPVYSKGEIGGSERIKVGIADASDPAKMPAIGITNTELTTTGSTQDGLITLVGVYNTNLSGFSGVSENDIVYVAVGGGLTITKPTGANLIQNVGIVLKTNGTIIQGLQVTCIGRTNDVPTPLYIDHANQRVGIGATSPLELLHLESTEPLIRLDDTNSGLHYIVGQDGDAFKFTTNNPTYGKYTFDSNVGIGTTSPSEKLDIAGNIKLNTGGYIVGDSTAVYLRLSNSLGSILGYSTGTIKVAPSFTYSNASGEQFRINHSDGNVGIGTNNPAYKLDINSSNAVGARISSSGFSNLDLVSERTSGNLGGIRFKQDVDSYITNELLALHGGGFDWKIGDGSSLPDIKMSLDSNGNVGIGTTSPAQKLHVIGDARIQGNLTVNGTYTQIDTDVNTTEQWLVTNDGTGPAAVINQLGTEDIFDVQDDGTSVFYIEDGGNIGIGTTNPSEKLEVVGNIKMNSVGNELQFANHNVGAYRDGNHRLILAGYGGIDFVSENVGGMENQAKRVRITPSGNVGIGTTSPSSKLHVDGNVAVANLTSSGYLKLGADNQIISDGSITIGIDYNNNQTDRVFNVRKDNTTELFRVQENGNVGIGTTSPGKLLDVNGTFRASGEAFLTGGFDITAAGRFRDGVALNFNTNRTARIFTDSNDLIIQQGEDDKDIRFKSDDGSGGVTEYFRVDGSSQAIIISKATAHGDNVKSYYGAGNDLSIYHDATNSYIQNETGNLYILNKSDDKDIVFQSDDGSGGLETYFFLDGSNGLTTFPDNKKLTFGNASDLRIFHDSGNSFINQTGTGHLYIQQSTDDHDIVFQSDDGSGGTTDYLRLDGSTKTNKFSERIEVYKADAAANPRVSIGRSSGEAINFDVEDRTARIYHKQDETTGFHDLKITVDSDTSDTKDIHLGFRDADGSNESIKFTLDENGDVGIGTTTPSEKLHVVGDLKIQTNVDAGVIHFGDTSDETKIVGYDSSDSNTRFDFFTSGSKKLTILDSGNVGIGTDSPSKKLDVNGDVLIESTNPALFFTDTNSDSDYSIKVNGGILNVRDETNDTARISLKSNGNVGIGTSSPSAKLEVSADGTTSQEIAHFGNSNDVGKIKMQLNSAGAGKQVILDGDNNVDIVLDAQGDSYFNISHGNVGIGTTSPGEKLEVDGNIAVSGSVQRQISTTHHTFTFGVAGSASQDYWVPFIGSSEQAAPNVTHRTVAPYTGILKKAIVHSTVAYGTSAQVRFHRINNGATKVFVNDNSTDDVTTNVTRSLATAYTSAEFVFTTGNTFSTGDQIGVSFVRDNTAQGDVVITLVWEYELF